MTEEEFEEHRPIINPHGDRGWGGTLWGSHGAELNFIRNQHENKVWTLVEVDGEMCIVTGFHWVNRVGYFVTENPWKEECEVRVPEDKVRRRSVFGR